MINLRTGVVELPEIKLDRNTTLESLYEVFGERIEITSFDNVEFVDENISLKTWVNFVVPLPAGPHWVITSLTCDEYNRLDYVLFQPTEFMNVDELDETRVAYWNDTITSTSISAGGIPRESYTEDVRYEHCNGQWQFPWGAIDYENPRCIDMYFRQPKEWIITREGGIYKFDEVDAQGNVQLMQKLVQCFNELKIPGMPEVEQLATYTGEFVNVPYTLPNGELCKFWDDEEKCWFAQLPKDDETFFLLTANSQYLMVAEHREMLLTPRILVFKSWR